MSLVYIFVMFVCFCGSSYGDLKGTLPIGTAVDNENEPFLFVLDKNGLIHVDNQPHHTITSRDERIKLRSSRRKRPLGEVVSEALTKKLGANPDLYGGEALLGDTTVPDGPDGGTGPYGLSGPRIEQRNKRAGDIIRYHEIETLLIFDYELFKFWLARNGNNAALAKAEMVDYYSNIVNAVNGRFETLGTPIFSVRMSVTGYIIADSPTATPWTQLLNVNNTVDSEASLNLFTGWVNQNRGNLPPHDHAITITGFDLTRNGRAAVVGLANQNQTCKAKSTSILEDLQSQELATLVAHEVAHSVGANHDGDKNTCSNDANNIMSTKIAIPDRGNAENPWTFSHCSARSVMEYLDTVAFKCSRIKSGKSLDLSPFLQEEFGQKYPHDVQCEIYRGTGSKMCRSVYSAANNLTFADLCYTLFCLDPVDQLCYPTLAHNGTSCGHKHWCSSGVCTFSELAPTTPENCPAGDDPDVACTPSMCNDPSVSQLCCGTCNPIPTPPPVTLPPFTPPVKPVTPIVPPFVTGKQPPFKDPFFKDIFSFDSFNSDPFDFKDHFHPFRPHDHPYGPSKPDNKPPDSHRPGSMDTGYDAFSDLQKNVDSLFGNFDDHFQFGFRKK